MSIDWSHFTPFTSLAGGVLIGAAAAMLILLNGRVAGISGMIGGLLARHLDAEACRDWGRSFGREAHVAQLASVIDEVVQRA